MILTEYRTQVRLRDRINLPRDDLLTSVIEMQSSLNVLARGALNIINEIGSDSSSWSENEVTDDIVSDKEKKDKDDNDDASGAGAGAGAGIAV